MLILVAGVAALVIGVASGYQIENKNLNKRLSVAQRTAEDLEIKNQAKIKDAVVKINQDIEEEVQDFKTEEEQDLLEQQEENQTRTEHLDVREKSLNSFSDRLDKIQESLQTRQNDLQDLQSQIDRTKNESKELQRKRQEIVYAKSGLSKEQAEQLVIQNTKTSLNRDYEITTRENHDFMVLNAAKDARNIMVEALQDGPVDVPRDHIERNITIPDEKIRNKVTGKNEQRLRLIETLTGVDLIFNPEAEETLIISTSDPIRREIARNAINEIIAARQINTGLIENIVANTQHHVMDNLRIFGETACSSLHIGWVDPDMMKLFGRLQYRTSYGQNVLQHSVEVAQLCGVMAAELGMDVQIAKRAGLFHDIGKAVDREVNGTHVELGVKIAEAYGEDPVVINSIAASHGDIDSDNPVSTLVRIADSMSGARPGARSESVEEYINRLKGLERIANAHAGVRDSYAIQAGREIRIIVDPKQMNDQQSDELTEQVCEQIEDELTYPGKIKVTTIRKLDAVQYVGGKPVPRKKHAS